jgi:hypothetical protein
VWLVAKDIKLLGLALSREGMGVQSFVDLALSAK